MIQQVHRGSRTYTQALGQHSEQSNLRSHMADKQADEDRWHKNKCMCQVLRRKIGQGGGEGAEHDRRQQVILVMRTRKEGLPGGQTLEHRPCNAFRVTALTGCRLL